MALIKLRRRVRNINFNFPAPIANRMNQLLLPARFFISSVTRNTTSLAFSQVNTQEDDCFDGIKNLSVTDEIIYCKVQPVAWDSLVYETVNTSVADPVFRFMIKKVLPFQSRKAVIVE